ncbi:hypothetical protein [Afipia felis]|nr:hypothetical protein [Afipia felis]
MTGTKGDGQAGACAAFDRPQFRVLGKTDYDQQWVDKQTEAGVAGCGWERPSERPPEWDKPLSGPVNAVEQQAPAKKKPGVWSRVKAKFKKKPPAAAGQG